MPKPKIRTPRQQIAHLRATVPYWGWLDLTDGPQCWACGCRYPYSVRYDGILCGLCRQCPHEQVEAIRIARLTGQSPHPWFYVGLPFTGEQAEQQAPTAPTGPAPGTR